MFEIGIVFPLKISTEIFFLCKKSLAYQNILIFSKLFLIIYFTDHQILLKYCGKYCSQYDFSHKY